MIQAKRSIHGDKNSGQGRASRLLDHSNGSKVLAKEVRINRDGNTDSVRPVADIPVNYLVVGNKPLSLGNDASGQ